MDLDHLDDDETRPATTAAPKIPDPDQIRVNGEPTITLSQRDRDETEACLLMGLLSLANGLIAPETLIRALDSWAGVPGRTLLEILVEWGRLDESDASMIASLASKHLEQHQGIARESLMALGNAVRFRLDPSEVADSELRIILTGFTEGPADPRPEGADGLGPRYEIRKEHAKGGLGIVSLAHDREIHRDVAVKEIQHRWAHNLEYRARFEREAEVTGRLEHPGIVPVYGMGKRADGRPYYIMRFIRGETLKAAISRLHKAVGDGEEALSGERPDLHALVGRFIDACHAIAYAHDRKILHRDIKPINIMLGPFGETLVVNWGLAKSFDGSRSGESPSPVEEGTLRPGSGSDLTPTRVGSQVGTIGYMSPEQAAGLSTELGPPSDIYSLGVTLHYLVTGHAPFEGAGKDEFFRRVREGDFPRPSKVNPDVPRALEEICLKAMALRPVDRYQHVTELIDDLERWRAGQPVLAYPEPPIDRLARWAKKHKTALAGAAVLLVCATIGLAVFAERKREENRRLAAANTAIRSAEQKTQADLKLTRGSLRMTLDGLSGPELAYLPNSGPPRLRLANSVLEFYRDLIKTHPADADVRSELAHACRVKANIGRSMGQFEPARGLYVEAIDLLEPIVAHSPDSDDHRISLAWAHIDAGEHLRMAGNPRLAEDEQLKAIDALKRPSTTRMDDRYAQAEAVALIDLAAARLATGRPHEALPQARRAIELLEPLVDTPRSLSNNRMFFIYALATRAYARGETGDREAAWKDLEEGGRRARELKSTLDNTDTRFALAMVLDEQGRFLSEGGKPAEAIKVFEAAHSLLTDLWKRNQRFVFLEKELANSWNGRGGARLALHRLQPDPKLLDLALVDCTKAREYFEKIATIWPENFEYQSELGRTLANMGRIALATNDQKKAANLLGQAIERHEQACKANRESPDDAKLADGLREELKRIGPAGSTSSPGR